MSRYRWVRFSQCIETMGALPGLEGRAEPELRKLLSDAVSGGQVRTMLNDEVVPKVHIGIYLSLYASATLDQEPYTLPPDLALSYDDLCAVFDRPMIDNRTRGRPKKEHAGWSEDRRLAFEMHKMLANHPSSIPAKTATEAARLLVDGGHVSGAGTPQSRVTRLVRTFRKYYSS